LSNDGCETPGESGREEYIAGAPSPRETLVKSPGGNAAGKGRNRNVEECFPLDLDQETQYILDDLSICETPGPGKEVVALFEDLARCDTFSVITAKGGLGMKKVFMLFLSVAFVVGAAGFVFAADNPLVANEKKVNKSFGAEVPADHVTNVFKLHEVWAKAMADPAYRSKVYLIDVRTTAEFKAFHIEGTDHVSSGLMYDIPKKITDPNAVIYIWCRTAHRAKYVAGFLYKYGYKNVYCVEPTTKDGKKYNGGVVGWAQAGFPFVNKYTGDFYIKAYRKNPSRAEMSFLFRK
jgi:rhodanese-related sulfurtransferase